MEKILKRKTVYHGNIVDVEEVDIDFGNNKNGTFELVNFHVETGVTILPIDQDDNIIMIQQFKLGLQQRILSLPSGGIEPGRDPYQVANDELQEEIGFKSNELTLMLRSHASPGYIGSIPSYIFLAKDLVPSKKPGDEIEEIIIKKMPFNAVEKMITSGEIVDSKTQLAVTYYKHYIRTI